MIEEAFAVATEFRFDVGQAMVNTRALQGAVDDVSKSANSAVSSLDFLASSLVARLGFGSGGLLSIMGKAVEISEQFNAGALNFANNISSNMQVLTGTIETFNDRLGTSEMIMNNINKTGIKFGLDAGILGKITQLLSTPLANRGKLGTNYQGAISMGKNLGLASEAVGLNPLLSGEMLSRAITDHMAIHGALFARLVNTQAFKQAHIVTQPQLMTMNTDKKIDLLSRSLEQLAGDAGWLAARIQRIDTQIVILKNQIGVLLKPIGEAITKPLKQVLVWLNTFLSANGEMIGKNIAAFISDIFADPKKLFIDLMQIKNLGKDFKKSLHVVELYGTFRFIKWVLEFLGVQLNGGLVRATLGYIVQGFRWLMAIVPWGALLRGAFTLLRAAFLEIAPIWAAAMLIFQGISRARGIAKAADIKELGEMTPRLSAVMVRWKHVFTTFMSPIQQIIEEIGQLLAPLFKTSTYLGWFLDASEALLPALEGCSGAFIDLAADIHGFSQFMKTELSYIFNLPKNLMNALTSVHPLDAMKDLLFSQEASDSWTKGRKDFLDDFAARNGKPNESSANYHVENNNHIEARFDMREQMEPDRIAFAVTTHLKKLAIDAVQGRGQSASSGLLGKTAGNT